MYHIGKYTIKMRIHRGVSNNLIINLIFPIFNRQIKPCHLDILLLLLLVYPLGANVLYKDILLLVSSCLLPLARHQSILVLSC